MYRLAAFADDPDCGNPAGVWIGPALPDADTMQRVAAKVGYSETAFVAPTSGAERTVRYFSPEAEVSFCGHATIAAGVVLGSTGGERVFRLATSVGEVPVTVGVADGHPRASLVSVNPEHAPAAESLLRQVLASIRWERHDLDDSIPPAVAYAGAWHLVLAASEDGRLADLDYDFEALKVIMLQANLTTLQLVWRETETLFHARNPFPVGGVVEDPATGAAAAAFGGYLRDSKLMAAPSTFTIRQGEAMGRPSVLTVDVPAIGGIVVTGAAVEINSTRP